MAILRANDARGMTDEQLKDKLSACLSEMALERGQIKTGGRTSNPGKISELRRTISRIRTILHERKIGIARVQVEKKKGKTGEQKTAPPAAQAKTTAATEKTATQPNAQKSATASMPAAAKSGNEQKPNPQNVTSNVQKQQANSASASQKTHGGKAPGEEVN